jgi:hypothetical protein
LLLYSVQLALQRCFARSAINAAAMMQQLAYKEVSGMELDELEPTGYFSEFSWHSFEEDGPPDTTSDLRDDMQLLAATGQDQERLEAEPLKVGQDNQGD